MTSLDALKEFQSLECKNPIKVSLACRVYQDLQRTKRYANLDKSYDVEFDIIYLTGTQKDKRHFFVPLHSCQDCDMYQLERLQSQLQETHKESVMHLAICDTASNVLYYTMTTGFLDKPESWHKKA